MTIYLAALNEKAEEKKAEREFDVIRTRRFMTMFANANRDSKRYPKGFTEQEIWPLESERQSVGAAPKSVEEFDEIIARALGKNWKSKKRK